MNFNELLKKAINASIKGGHAIMEVYASEFAVEHKDDRSPLIDALIAFFNNSLKFILLVLIFRYRLLALLMFQSYLRLLLSLHLHLVDLKYLQMLLLSNFQTQI